MVKCSEPNDLLVYDAEPLNQTIKETLFLVFFCHFSGLFIVSFKCFSARYNTSVREARPHQGICMEKDGS